ncbi:hypothetical protein BCU84_04815 [Shewanella sp. 10N.286.51.B7]|nr:hypothetical protein BCU84_04815 [Shewanella sp. 10N.286.51.B7]
MHSTQNVINEMEFNLKIIISLLFIFALQGCKSTKIPEYEPSTNTNSAELKVSAGLSGLFLHGKVTQLEIFDGCYKKNYNSENVIGHVITEHKDKTPDILLIPAGNKLYFQFGTTEPSWNCHTHFSFTPLLDEKYEIHYGMAFAGCEVKVSNRGNIVRDVEFLTAEPGYSKEWRKCTEEI